MADQKNKTRAKVLQFLRKYKQRAGCRLCGENSSADVLDFHHIHPGAKKMSITEMARSTGLFNILEEIEKCVVLCSNCHRKMHAESSRKK